MLQGIKVIKLQAWEEKFLAKVAEARKVEMAAQRRLFVLHAVNNTIFCGSPLVIALATFALHAALGRQLVVSSALTSLALFNMIRFPIQNLPSFISALMEAKVSIDRLQGYASLSLSL